MFVVEGSTIVTLFANHVGFKEHNIQCSHEHDIINISQGNIVMRWCGTIFRKGYKKINSKFWCACRPIYYSNHNRTSPVNNPIKLYYFAF